MSGRTKTNFKTRTLEPTLFETRSQDEKLIEQVNHCYERLVDKLLKTHTVWNDEDSDSEITSEWMAFRLEDIMTDFDTYLHAIKKAGAGIQHIPNHFDYKEDDEE